MSFAEYELSTNKETNMFSLKRGSNGETISTHNSREEAIAAANAEFSPCIVNNDIGGRSLVRRETAGGTYVPCGFIIDEVEFVVCE